jgi:peptidylprolyl isomerase
MLGTVLLSLITLLSPVSFAADAATAATADDPVVARVEGVEIHASEFAAAAKRARPADGVALSTAERQAVLDTIVGDRLLYVEAKNNAEVLADAAVRDAMVRVLLRDEIAGAVPEPTDAELEAYYEANKAKFMTTDSVRSSRILVRTSAKKDAKTAAAEANALWKKVSADPKSTFAETAKTSSNDPNKADGGDMGLVTRTDKKLDPVLRKMAFATKAGTVSKVFMTKEGANILYVVARKAPQQKSFDAARADVEKKWKAEKVAAAKQKHVDALRKSAKVSVDKAALAAVALPERKGKATKAAGGGTDDDGDDEGADEEDGADE